MQARREIIITKLKTLAAALLPRVPLPDHRRKHSASLEAGTAAMADAQRVASLLASCSPASSHSRTEAPGEVLSGGSTVVLKGQQARVASRILGGWLQRNQQHPYPTLKVSLSFFLALSHSSL
jgi:hypothetical protein